MATQPSYGINTAPDIPTGDIPETPSTSGTGKHAQTNPDRLALLKSRLKVAKAWSKRPHEAMKRWIAEYNIEDVKNTDEVRDKVRIGYIFRKIESDLPNIFDDQPQLFIKGRTAQATQIQPLIEGLYDFLWDMQKLDQQIEDVGLYFELLGMGFMESPWVTKTQKVSNKKSTPVLDEEGQETTDDESGEPNEVDEEDEYEVAIVDHPMAKAVDPFKLYFSPETKFAPRLDYENCPYYFRELVMTVDEVEGRFGVRVDTTESLKVNQVDVDAEIDRLTNQGARDDLKRVTVYEYYGCLPKDMAPKGSDWSYDEDYHIYFTTKEEIRAEDNPYTTKPLFVLGNYGLATDFWKFGDAKHLMPLVQELQMYRSHILQHTRKMANPKPMIPDMANVDEAAFMDPRVGRPVKFSGPTPPTYLSPANLGREVEAGINMVRTDLEKTAGSFDLENGGGESQVKTPRGIQVFSEAADKNVERKRKKVARFIRELLVFQFQQVAQNWKPEDAKTLAIVAPDVSPTQPQQTPAPQDPTQGQLLAGQPMPPQAPGQSPMAQGQAPQPQGGPTAIQVTQEVLDVIGGVNTLYMLDIETESLSINRVQMRQDWLNLWDLASQHPDIFDLTELARDGLQNAFGKRDADRFLLTDQEKQAMSQQKPEPPKVSVQIKADAATPPGAALLEQEGLLQPGSGQKAVIDNQVMNHVAAENEAQRQQASDAATRVGETAHQAALSAQQAQTEQEHMALQGKQSQEQAAMQGIAQGVQGQQAGQQKMGQQKDAQQHQLKMAELGNVHKQEQQFAQAALKPQPEVNPLKKGGTNGIKHKKGN